MSSVAKIVGRKSQTMQAPLSDFRAYHCDCLRDVVADCRQRSRQEPKFPSPARPRCYRLCGRSRCRDDGSADRRVISTAGAEGCCRQRMVGDAVHQLPLTLDFDCGGVMAESTHAFGEPALLGKRRPRIRGITQHEDAVRLDRRNPIQTVGRIEKQHPAMLCAETGCKLPVFALDIVNDCRSRPGQKRWNDEPDALAGTRGCKSQYMFRTIVPEIVRP